MFMVIRRPSGSIPRPSRLPVDMGYAAISPRSPHAVVGVHLRRGAARGVIAEGEKSTVFFRISSSPGALSMVTLFREIRGQSKPDTRPAPAHRKKQVFPVFLQRRPDIFRFAT